jgi:hypothetical protein
LLTERMVIPARRETLQSRLEWRLREREARINAWAATYGKSVSDKWLEDEIHILEQALREGNNILSESTNILGAPRRLFTREDPPHDALAENGAAEDAK